MKRIVVKKLLLIPLAVILTIIAFPFQAMADISLKEDEFSISAITFGEEDATFDMPVSIIKTYNDDDGNVVNRSKSKLSGWKTKKGKKYYYNAKGVPLKGFWRIGSNIYYFNKKGAMQTGQTKIGKKVYFFTSKGHIKFGWVMVKGKRRFFSTNGTVGSVLNVKNVKGNYKKGTVYGPTSSTKELKQVKGAVKNFLNKEIASNMTDYEKVKAAHDYLVRICSYENSSNWAAINRANTAYGALINKKAQCGGYSRAFKALCDGMGIKSYHVRASRASINPNHQWNIVKVGKEYYHIDVQCNDSSGFNAIFLRSDRRVESIGLRWKKSKYPKCKKDYVLKVKLK